MAPKGADFIMVAGPPKFGETAPSAFGKMAGTMGNHPYNYYLIILC